MNCRYRGGWLLFVCSNSKKSCCVYVAGKKDSQLTGQVYVFSPWQKGDTHREEKKWMIHGIDHDRIQKVLFLPQEKVVSWFVRVASCFMSHLRNPIVPCFFFVFFVFLWRRRCRDGVSCGSSPTTKIGCIVDRSFRPMPPMTTIVIPSMNCRNACPIVDPHPHIIRAPLF
jgi:hypothetical protein